MKYDLKIHERLIMEWFSNVAKGKQNDEILFLEVLLSNDIIESIHKLFKKHRIPKNEYIIVDKNEYIRNFSQYGNTKNIISFQFDELKDFSKYPGFQRFVNQKLLFVPKEIDFLINMEKYIDLNNISSDSKENISEEERYLYYIEKVDPLDLIKNKTQPELAYLLENFRIRSHILWDNCNTSSLLLNKINYKSGNLKDSFNSDIYCFLSHKILISRLAVFIYRVATLNLGATATEAGRYFHKKLGAKSKTYNYKLIHKLKRSNNTHSSDLINKNFKAYDLEVNELEITIRKEIAQNLINLKKTNLDADTISKATKLPIEKIEKLIKQVKYYV